MSQNIYDCGDFQVQTILSRNMMGFMLFQFSGQVFVSQTHTNIGGQTGHMNITLILRILLCDTNSRKL